MVTANKTELRRKAIANPFWAAEHLTAMQNRIVQLEDALHRLDNDIMLMLANAGISDSGDACRAVIRTGKEALRAVRQVLRPLVSVDRAVRES